MAIFRTGIRLEDKYVIESELGSGGMSTVFLAWDELLNRKVAIKVLRQGAMGAVREKRLLREAKALSSLAHENIAHFYHAGILDGTPYLVMEFVEGETLRSLLSREQRLRSDMIISIASQICCGLECAHASGIIHRDLKPENIVLVKNKDEITAKILDFGLCKLITGTDSTLTQTGEIVGTTYYMAPELILGQACTAATDIYSLGCMLYEMITGETPFGESSPDKILLMQITSSTPKFMDRKGSGKFPEELEDIVMRCTEKLPANRFQNVAEIKGQLVSIATEKTGERFQPSNKAAMPTGKLPVALCILAALLLITTSFLFILFRPSVQDPFVKTTDQEKISQDIQRAKAKSPQDLKNLLALGRLQLRSDLVQDRRDALKTYTQAVELCKPGTQLSERRFACLALKAKSEWLLGDFAAAERDFNQSAEATRTSNPGVWPDVLLERARFLVHRHRFDEALRDFNNAANCFTLNPGNWVTSAESVDKSYQNLDRGGGSRIELGKKVAQELRKIKPQSDAEAAQITELSESILNLLGRTKVIIRMQAPAERKKISQEIQSLKTRAVQDLNSLLNLGSMQLRSELKQDNLDALKTLSQAVELSKTAKVTGDRPFACLTLKAKAEWLQNKNAAAEEDFNQSVEATRKAFPGVCIDALLERSRFLVHMRRYNEALQDLNDAIASLEQIPDGSDIRLQELDRSGDSRENLLNNIADTLRRVDPLSEAEAAAKMKLSTSLKNALLRFKLRTLIVSTQRSPGELAACVQLATQGHGAYSAYSSPPGAL